MIKTMTWGSAGSCLLAALLSTSCITVKDNCPDGERGCPCDDGECDSSSLECIDGMCVRSHDDGDGGASQSGGSGGNGNATNGGSGAQGGTGPSGSGGSVTQEEGPTVTCPYPEPAATAILIEELSNPVNQANNALAPWWRLLEFGTRGGLLRAGGIDCVPYALTDNSNAVCYDGYDCGGCPMVLRAGDDNGKQTFYFVPEQGKWTLPECAPLAAFYGVFPGDKEPTHACDLELTENRCLCAGTEPISIFTKSLSTSDGVLCHLNEETDPRQKSGTNDSCAHLFECDIGSTTCAAAVLANIDRATGEITWHVGGSYATELDACPTLAVPSADVTEASSCPDATAAASACSACIDACSGVPECYCTSECASTSYSCEP